MFNKSEHVLVWKIIDFNIKLRKVGIIVVI